MKSKRFLSFLLVACLLISALPAVAPVTHAATNDGLDVVTDPTIGGTYYLAANVDGQMIYFTTGTVTATAPYSLVTTERIAVAVPVILENPDVAKESTGVGFQLTYNNNGSTARIYCMDVLKDATTAGQTGIMDTGVNTSEPYRGRHTFNLVEIDGQKVLQKLANNNVLVVKYFESTKTYRMLGVPVAELENEGVYPVSLYAEHTHKTSTQAAVIDDNNHGYACGCGSIVSTEVHTYGQTTVDATAKTSSRTCTACGYVQTVYGNSQLQVNFPIIGETYNLVANVDGQLLSLKTQGGGYTGTTPYSMSTTTTLNTVTLQAALEAGKGEFQLVGSTGYYLYSIAAGAGETVSSGYITKPDRVSFLMDTVNGQKVIRAYGTQNILAVKYSSTKSAYRIFAVAESELANEGVYPVVLTKAHTHSYGTAYEKDENGHWQVCDCGDTTDKTAHSFVDGKCICGKLETEAVLQEGIYYLKATRNGVIHYFRQTGTGEKVTYTAPYSLYTDTDKSAATLVDAIKETSGDFSLGYPYNGNTARIYVYDVGNNGSVDTGVNTQNVAANHHFLCDGETGRLYQLEGGIKYVLAIKELNNTNTGTKQIRMLAVPESELSDTVVAVELEAHTTHTVDKWVVQTPATTGTTGLKTGTCTVCGRQVEEEIPVLIPAFCGNNVSLDNTFSLHFYVDKAAFADGTYQNPSVTFTLEGAETTVSAYTQDDESYIFTFDEITPDKMGQTVTATLHADKQGGTQFSTTANYSVAKYCYDMLEAQQTGDALRTLLVDTLNFGAACQKYQNSDISEAELVSANLTEEERSWGSSAPLRELASCKNIGTNNGKVKWYGVSALMGDRVQMRVYFDAQNTEDISVRAETADITWTLTDIQSKDGRCYVDFSHLAPTQMSEEVTFTVYRGETAVSSTMHYSLESYAASWLGRDNASDAQKALVTAMIRYGDAAKAYAERAYNLEEDVLYLGRTYSQSGAQWFNWSAAGFSVRFQGSGLKAKIASNAPDATNYAYLKVYVDGVEQEDILLDEKLQTVTLAQGLDPEEIHIVEVRKRNSPRSSTAGLLSLELLDGEKLAPAEAKDKLIEFVGDSLTVGYSAADADKSESGWSTKTEDGTKTYSKQVADAFGAEYMVTAISGRGVVMNNAGGSGYLLPEIYPELDIYNNPGTAYDFAQQPDVIVINLGTNDATNSSLDIAAFQAGVVSFINTVRAKNPNAEIIWAYGLRSDKMTKEVDAAIQAAIAQVNQGGDHNVYYLALPLAEDMHLNHPTAAAYAPSGEVLIEKIAEITGWQQ